LSAGEWPKPWYRGMFAPWRMKYIREHVERGGPAGCVFCEAPARGDEESLIVYRGRKAYIILNKYPYNSGHVMVVPYRHVANLADLDDDELLEIGKLTRLAIRALEAEYKPHGFNVGVNIGEAAGAGIAGHVHVHILPRWRGDTNFTVITSGTKVVPESLEETWRRLYRAIREVAGEGGEK